MTVQTKMSFNIDFLLYRNYKVIHYYDVLTHAGGYLNVVVVSNFIAVYKIKIYVILFSKHDERFHKI